MKYQSLFIDGMSLEVEINVLVFFLFMKFFDFKLDFFFEGFQ